MADKAKERQVVDIVLKHTLELQAFNDISKEGQERPDFVFRKGSAVIGLENIELSIVPKDKQNADHYYDGKAIELLHEWKDKYSLDQDGALQALEKHINMRRETYCDFSYSKHLADCARLLGVDPKSKKHNTTAYIHELSSEHQDCKIEIRFVLEIGYDSKSLSIDHTPRFQVRNRRTEPFHEQLMLDYPLTWGFIDLLRRVKNIRTFYLIWHPYDIYKGKRVKCYTVHFDEKRQLINKTNLPHIWSDFDLPDRKEFKNMDIKLKLEE